MNSPTISMRDFFALPEVLAAQEVQKRHPYGSPEHTKATEALRALAASYGAERFFD